MGYNTVPETPHMGAGEEDWNFVIFVWDFLQRSLSLSDRIEQNLVNTIMMSFDFSFWPPSILAVNGIQGRATIRSLLLTKLVHASRKCCFHWFVVQYDVMHIFSLHWASLLRYNCYSPSSLGRKVDFDLWHMSLGGPNPPHLNWISRNILLEIYAADYLYVWWLLPFISTLSFLRFLLLFFLSLQLISAPGEMAW